MRKLQRSSVSTQGRPTAYSWRVAAEDDHSLTLSCSIAKQLPDQVPKHRQRALGATLHLLQARTRNPAPPTSDTLAHYLFQSRRQGPDLRFAPLARAMVQVARCHHSSLT